jgi:hypothetical protein
MVCDTNGIVNQTRKYQHEYIKASTPNINQLGHDNYVTAYIPARSEHKALVGLQK